MDFDVVVVGGGVTGTGVARDLALRGLRTLLLEKDDFASGTSGQCMGLLHGGPRYLLYDPKVTIESCRESGILQRLAPQLVYRVPFLVPSYPEDKYPLRVMDAFFREYDRYAPLKNSFPHRVLSPEDALAIEPGLRPGLTGAITMDEWGCDVSRMVWLTARGAAEAGATVLNHAEVVGFDRDGERVTAVRYRHLGAERTATARAFVNAAGPWVPRVAGLAGVDHPLKPTKGVQVVYDRPLTNVGVSAQTEDGRTIELVPHRGLTVIGRTDTFYEGDPADAVATADDVRGLLRDAARVFAPLAKAKPHRVLSGVRPILDGTGDNEYRMSRDHRVTLHGENLVTIAGGKMVTHRLMAEQAADKVCELLDVDAPCRTADVPLPDAWPLLPPRHAERPADVTAAIARMQRERHGARPPGGDRLVCPCELITEDEVRHAARHERCVTVKDLFHRVRLAWGPCGGNGCATHASRLLAEEHGWTEEQRERDLASFTDWIARRNAPLAEATE